MSAAKELNRLLDVVAQLRNPETGGAWDRVQTHQSIAPYAIEESYEVLDAIERLDWEALSDELGDLLLQIIYHARIAEEAERFDLETIIRKIAEKMIRRHPHVFGAETLDNDTWERSKAAERASRREYGLLAGVAQALPALTRAEKLGKRAARVGFDWDQPEQVLKKIEEELNELRAELPEGNKERLQDELGDVFFTTVSLARKLGFDPEACLRHGNAKFTQRIEAMEARAAKTGCNLSDLTLPEQEALWSAVKRELS